MINIVKGAQVTVRNLIIDGQGDDGQENSDNTKHGLNVYGNETTVTVENVTIKNGNGYGIVINGGQATINNLTTSDNGWGGINVDSKSGSASLIIENANISELNSVRIENTLILLIRMIIRRSGFRKAYSNILLRELKSRKRI